MYAAGKSYFYCPKPQASSLGVSLSRGVVSMGGGSEEAESRGSGQRPGEREGWAFLRPPSCKEEGPIAWDKHSPAGGCRRSLWKDSTLGTRL